MSNTLKLQQYIEAKIGQMNELLLQYRGQHEIEMAKPEEDQNDTLIALIEGKIQAYYTIIKSFRADQRQLELTQNDSNNNNKGNNNIIT